MSINLLAMVAGYVGEKIAGVYERKVDSILTDPRTVLHPDGKEYVFSVTVAEDTIVSKFEAECLVSGVAGRTKRTHQQVKSAFAIVDVKAYTELWAAMGVDDVRIASNKRRAEKDAAEKAEASKKAA